MSLSAAANTSFENILFATDFSSSSAAAMSYAAWLGKHFDSLLNIVNVVPAEIVEGAQPPDPFHFKHTAESKLSSMVASAVFDGVRHREFVEEAEGDLSDVLLRLIRQLEIDLIVLGTHGRGGLSKVLLGSTSEELAYSSPCSVLTVGPEVGSLTNGRLKIEQILCVTDLLPGSEQLLQYALRLMEHEHARLHILHTINPAAEGHRTSLEIQRAKAVTTIEQLVQQETGPKLAISILGEVGSPAKQTLKTAHDLHADLILIGQPSVSLPRLAAHLPWPAIHQLLRHAECPVLTVRH